jgi:5-methyltetrahydrofolate--homocysteine methyltransferase
MEKKTDLMAAIAESLVQGQASKVKELTEAAIREGVSLRRILNGGLLAGMSLIGERFKKEEIYLPEVLFSARAMKAGMDVLEPLLAAAGVKPVAKMVLGTVKGDIHDIGKNLVGVMMRGAGFEVIDIGIDAPPDKFVAAVRQHRARLVGMSALTGMTMPAMKTTVEAFDAAGLRGQVKIMVGGAIVTQTYADSIGADGYAPDAALAVDKAKQLLGG